MTNANLPGRWLVDPQLEELSDRAWRMFTGSLMYAAEQGTDGVIGRPALRLLHPEGFDLKAAQELLAAGRWEVHGSGYRVVDWAKTQSTAEQVEHYRERGRVKKAKQRANAKTGESPGGQQQGTDPGESTREVVQTRQDQTRPSSEGAEPQAGQGDWPPVAVPGSSAVAPLRFGPGVEQAAHDVSWAAGL